LPARRRRRKQQSSAIRSSIRSVLPRHETAPRR
jgi:hypothetical protein